MKTLILSIMCLSASFAFAQRSNLLAQGIRNGTIHVMTPTEHKQAKRRAAKKWASYSPKKRALINKYKRERRIRREKNKRYRVKNKKRTRNIRMVCGTNSIKQESNAAKRRMRRKPRVARYTVKRSIKTRTNKRSHGEREYNGNKGNNIKARKSGGRKPAGKLCDAARDFETMVKSGTILGPMNEATGDPAGDLSGAVCGDGDDKGKDNNSGNDSDSGNRK